MLPRNASRVRLTPRVNGAVRYLSQGSLAVYQNPVLENRYALGILLRASQT